MPVFSTDHDDVVEPFTEPLFELWNRQHGTAHDWQQLTSTTYHDAVGCEREEMNRFILEMMERRMDPNTWVPPDPATVAGLALVARYRRIIVTTARVPELQEITEAYYDRYLPGVISDVEPVGETVGFRPINLLGNHFSGAAYRTKQEFLEYVGAAEHVDDAPYNLVGANLHRYEGVLYGTYPWGDGFDCGAHGCWRATGGWPQIASRIRAKTEAHERRPITS